VRTTSPATNRSGDVAYRAEENLVSHALRTPGVLANVVARYRFRLRPATTPTTPTCVAGPNEVAADVLGLGDEQVVRLNGSRVEIVTPESRGGGVGVVTSFEAGTTATWPGCDLPFHGQDVLRAVGHEASRVAVVGRRIAVSVVHCPADPMSNRRGSSAVELYEPDGTLVTRRVFADGVAVTALDGVVVDGVAYLAIGLSASGVRVALADEPGLPDHHRLPADWRRHVARRKDREIVVAVRFGTADDGRPVLVCAAITVDGTALVVTDVLDGRLLWSDNILTGEPLRDRPTSIAVGPFGRTGVPTVSVAWSSGRLTLHDASRGTRPYQVEPQPENAVTAQSFVTGDDGQRLLAVRRQIDAILLAAGTGNRQVVRV
jgi:hypothetical protein